MTTTVSDLITFLRRTKGCTRKRALRILRRVDEGLQPSFDVCQFLHMGCTAMTWRFHERRLFVEITKAQTTVVIEDMEDTDEDGVPTIFDEYQKPGRITEAEVVNCVASFLLRGELPGPGEKCSFNAVHAAAWEAFYAANKCE